MKKFNIFLACVIAAVLLWRFWQPIEKFFQKSSAVVNNISKDSLGAQIQNLEKQIFAPPPLRGGGEVSGNLTRVGVILQTNLQRQQNGNLPALRENSQLDVAAQAKLKDMFNQQYFEHENPQGKGPADLAKAAGYEYIAIGENLALGNFTDDKDLVEAWMNSPGHRANILTARYMEIGVAVGRGSFEGKQVWLAVQEFGKPQSSCPGIESALKSQINSLEADVKQIEPQLTSLKNQIDSDDPKTQKEYDDYNQKVTQYNALVKIYNNKVDSLKLITERYNAGVRAYNACAAG